MYVILGSIREYSVGSEDDVVSDVYLRHLRNLPNTDGHCRVRDVHLRHVRNLLNTDGDCRVCDVGLRHLRKLRIFTDTTECDVHLRHRRNNYQLVTIVAEYLWERTQEILSVFDFYSFESYFS